MAIIDSLSQLSAQPGRFLLNARDQHLVVDASPGRGGQGQAWQAAELLLGALQTCSHAVIDDEARKRGWQHYGLAIQARCEADEDRPGHYRYIELTYRFTGITQAQAEELVQVFTTVCPIYGSLSRGAPVTLHVLA
ncbi:OsmC family protein [Kerstersia similis]|uniref:OsmC family protein n=1 Tax=Kerstersia similis TaxID=206505 RepID=UPI0039EE8FC8